MNTELKKLLSYICALFVLGLVALSFPQRVIADDDDPPGRVARLNYIRGSVSFQPAGEMDWVSAMVNRPMTTGDRLWADNGARAEMHLGSATIRLDANTGFSFLNLDDQTVQVQLSEGTLNIRVKRVDPDEILEVDAPNLAFSILQPGQYRIQASDDGNTTIVTVRSGRGEATGGGRTYTVNSGLSGTFSGTDYLQADIYRADDNNEFDNWSRDRDRRDDSSRSARYVSHDLVGYEDLDDNGTWRSDPNYGDIWVPRVSAGWAPYREGHWAWISPWGWTWVDDAPWGYAPFHYGRWVNVRGDWCWVPGPVAVRPVYAPALVAFIGGPRFGLSISVGGGGNVGWFPLGPREVYVPGYNTSRAYVNRVNVSNTTVNNTTITNVYNTQVTNINNNTTNRTEINYANRTVPGGVTAVPQAAFTTAQPVARAAVKIDAQQIASAPVNSRAAFVPTRSSVLGTSASDSTRVVQPPAAVTTRTVVAKTPPPPPPVPFEKQQQSLAAHPGQPLARTEVQNLRPANAPVVQPLVIQAPPGKPAIANTNQPGNVRPSNVPPPTPAANAPVNNAPPARNERPQDRTNRGQQGNVQPSNVPPPAPAANAPVNNTPPTRNERPQDRSNQGQQGNVQPSNVPSPTPAANAPVNNTPPARNERPQDRTNRGQQGDVQPSNVPPPTPATNAPVNNTPPTRNERPQDRSNQGQQGNVQPSNVPPPAPAANAPVNNAPPARNERPQDRPNRGQQGNVQPSNVPPPTPAANAPVNNAPPTRNDRPQDRTNRGQQGNVQPSNVPPPSPAANAPVNNAPPIRNDRPQDRSNRGQQANQQPAKTSDSKRTANPQADQPPKETPQETKDRLAREKKKNKDDQSQQH